MSYPKLFLKFRNEFFISFSLLAVFLLSFYGTKFQFYFLKWHYLSTPIGLVDAISQRDEELSGWLGYLLSQNAVATDSIFQISLALVTAAVSLLYILKNKGDKK